MADREESAISDPRTTLQNFSNRQESAFQYDDPAKYQTDVNIQKARLTNRKLCIFRLHQNRKMKL
jgi:hypothetical protein